MSAVTIARGLVVDPLTGQSRTGDLHLSGGIVAGALGEGEAAMASVVDAEGCWVLPGFVDLRCRLRSERDVTMALAAGFTTVLEAPDGPALRSERLRCLKAAPLTRDLAGEELGEVPDGTSCLSNGDRPIARAGVLWRALQYAASLDVLVMVHAEDPTLTGRGVLGLGTVATRLGLFGVPSAAETAAVARDLEVLAAGGGRLHFSHLTCARSVALVREAKRRGLRVSADVTPHHLTLDTSAAEGYSLAARVWPPLRDPEDVLALREGVADGTIDAIASDHQAVDPLEREHPFEQCVPGRESYGDFIPRVLGLELEPLRLAKLLTEVPSRLLGLPLHGLRPGARGDVVVIDPVARAVEAVIFGGELVYSREASGT